MQKELSFQQISTVYGMHIGCEVLAPDPEEIKEFRKGYITGYSGEFGVEIQFIEDDGVNVYESACYENHGKAKIILTPLSELTEEHKTIIAKAYGGDWCKLDDDMFLQVIKYDGEVVYHFILTHYFPYNLADFFRANGYALPYDGVNLYEAGIAIKPTAQ